MGCTDRALSSGGKGGGGGAVVRRGVGSPAPIPKLSWLSWNLRAGLDWLNCHWREECQGHGCKKAE